MSIFIVISGIVGPRIISGGILFRDGFALYGGIGKALIFGCVAFVLLARHHKADMTIRPWKPVLLGWIAAAAITFAIAWASINMLLLGERGFQNLAFAHGCLILSLILAAIGCLGPANMRLLWHGYRQIIMGSAAIAAVFYLFLLAVYALWQPLASIVLHSVKELLGLVGLEVTVVRPHTLMFDKFGVTIAEYCSGVESIALFTGLYAIVGLLDWKRMNIRRYFIVLPFALLGLCLCNILRVFGLIMAGYHINPQIAFSLFHTYAGMVFFILYSVVFWSIAYKYLLKKDTPHASKHTS
ncbi:MAG: archaeosortase/exosortase family protein [Patescibacteria group bacterium]